MKTPSQEAMAQLMFWTGLGCLPLSIILGFLGTLSRKLGIAVLLFITAGFSFTHSLWYFNALGGALGTKIGSYTAPSWTSFLPYGLGGALISIFLWGAFKNIERKSRTRRLR